MKYEIVVIGGGPAGTLVATGLASGGKSVIQLVSAERSNSRPFEVLTPAARQLLRKNNLPEPVSGVSNCRGVLSAWEDSRPDLLDYELTTCMPGLSIDRNAFHNALQGAAVEKGIDLVTMSKAGINNAIKQLYQFDSCTLENGITISSPELIIDASGRQSNFTSDEHSLKQYFSRQVALSVPYQVSQWKDYLLVEAVPGGWWYVPPSIEERTQLVFLTDSDTIPVNHSERAKWLSQCYQQSFIINKHGIGQPDFENAVGADARFFRHTAPANRRKISVGDAALALDPLSGAGTWAALAGAEQLVSLINKGGEINRPYSDWYQSFFEREQLLFKETCLKALARFPDSRFWQRRLKGEA